IMLFGMYGSAPEWVSIDLANILLFTAFAVTWTGARVFDGRRPEPLYIVLGAVLWLLLSRVPMIHDSRGAVVLLSSAIVASYTWLTAYEFWQSRSEPLVSRWPAIFLLFAHGSLYLLRTPLSEMLPWSPENQVFGSVWLTVLSFEGLLFTIAIAFLLLAMAKERTELRHRTAAMIDPLTGIANRRAFMEEAGHSLKREAGQPRSIAVLAIDLDNFKHINDCYGHAIGDRVLQIFAEGASGNLRPADRIGRLGGEEFAAVLYDTGHDLAFHMAERIRTTFNESTANVEGYPVGGTLSIGLVMAETGAAELDQLLAQADQALYRAKERGRNRVETAVLERRTDNARVQAIRSVAAKTAA
ncbi:MAG TPA: GGDEF domain-containing protein, partial [Bradyrhizobium sp.]|nr:GGDEF domain-containing protein [Bradyrhizobium sp.]